MLDIISGWNMFLFIQNTTVAPRTPPLVVTDCHSHRRSASPKQARIHLALAYPGRWALLALESHDLVHSSWTEWPQTGPGTLRVGATTTALCR